MSIGLMSHFVLHSRAHTAERRRHRASGHEGTKSAEWGDNVEHDVRAKIKNERKLQARMERERYDAWHEKWDNLSSSNKRIILAWKCETDKLLGLYELRQEYGDAKHMLDEGYGYELARLYQDKIKTLTKDERAKKRQYELTISRINEADRHRGMTPDVYEQSWRNALTDEDIDPVTTNALSFKELFSRKRKQFTGLMTEETYYKSVEKDVDVLQRSLNRLPEEKQRKLAAKTLVEFMDENYLRPSSDSAPAWMYSFMVKNDLEKGRGYKYKEKIAAYNDYRRIDQAQNGVSTFMLALLEKYDTHNGLTPDDYVAAMERRERSDRQSKVMEKIGEELITAANEEEEY